MTIATRDEASIIELALVEGDLSKLSTAQCVEYYQRVCDSMGLNQYTKPFEYLRLNNRKVLYATKNATDQLRKIHGVSITNLKHTQMGALYVVTASAEDKTGRQDSEIGVVPIEGLRGEALSNAMMKATTKAKRRVTLSLCGLGMLDESEVDSIPTAVVVPSELSADDTKRLAAKYTQIHGSDDVDERVQALLMQNTKLAQEAKDAGVKLGEIRRYTAQKEWPIGSIEQANGALEEAIKSHNQDLDTQAAVQSGQRAFP
jgi:hypothetical protein